MCLPSKKSSFFYVCVLILPQGLCCEWCLLAKGCTQTYHKNLIQQKLCLFLCVFLLARNISKYVGSESKVGAQYHRQGLSIPVSDTGPAKAGCYQGFSGRSSVHEAVFQVSDSFPGYNTKSLPQRVYSIKQVKDR